jgi:integrase
MVSPQPEISEILRRLQQPLLERSQAQTQKEGRKMRNRDGRVFQRKGSPYWWIAFYAHGKEVREVARHVRTGEKLEATDENRRDAERFKKQKLGQLAASQYGGPAFIGPQQARVTINELLDSLETDYRIRGKWSIKVATLVKPLRQYFGTWRAIEVDSDAVDKYIQQLQGEDYRNASINRRTQLLGQSFKLAVEKKRLSADSIPKITRLSELDNVRQGFFEKPDFEAVVAHLPEYLRDFVRFGFITGWRRGSISTLGWDVVGDGVIYLRAENAKQRTAESIPLQGELADIIERRRSARIIEAEDGTKRIAEYVFHRDGLPIGDFRKAWKTACKAANVDKKLFHDLRRTSARNMIDAGVPQVTAMEITGHNTDSMFRRYAIVNEDQKREALARTEQHLAARAERKVVAMAKER